MMEKTQKNIEKEMATIKEELQNNTKKKDSKDKFASQNFVALNETKTQKILLTLFEIRKDLEEKNPDIVKRLVSLDKEILKETGIKFSDKDKEKILKMMRAFR